jgi:hypothetical protein
VFSSVAFSQQAFSVNAWLFDSVSGGGRYYLGKKKRSVILDGEVLNLSDTELNQILLLEAKKPLVEQSISKSALAKVPEKVQAYFPNYPQLIAKLDISNANILKELVAIEMEKIEEEEMIMMVML